MTVEQALSNFMEVYGLPILLMSVIIILLIGILKYFKVFDKITNKNVKKFIYYVLDIALSFCLVAIYYAIYDISFKTYLNYCYKTIVATSVMYAIYENFGLRKLLHWLGTWFVNFIAKKQIETAKTQITSKDAKSVASEKSTSYGTAIQNIGK